MQILWTEGATRNLDSIEAYIAQDNPRAAAKAVLKIVRRVQEQVKMYPGSGKPGRIDGTRELIFPGLPYIVVYTLRNDTIFIIRVFHAARQL